MKEDQKSLLIKTSSQYQIPQGVKLSYGTAGFRADVSILESTVYRVGILSALRSLKTQSVIGLMITASHNKVSDNGVKVSDPSGGMLTQDWEPFADRVANAQNPPTFTPGQLSGVFVYFMNKNLPSRIDLKAVCV